VDTGVGGGGFAGVELRIVRPDQKLHGVVLHAGPPVSWIDGYVLCPGEVWGD
jgi:hypothetical protein